MVFSGALGRPIQSPITLASAAGILSISTFNNKGTITVSAGTFNPSGTWLNQGVIAVTGASATVNLGGTFSTVGTIHQTAGKVNITGVFTVNGTLALTATTG